MSSSNNHNTFPFGLVLTMIFVVLKLCGLINWSWVWVLSPLWIGWLIVIALIIIFSIKNWLNDALDN